MRAEQERKEQVEPLAVAAKPSEPFGKLVRGLAVKLRQFGESRDDVAVKRDPLAGRKLERAPHAPLAQCKRGRERLGIDLVIVALKRGSHGVGQIVLG
jgi:hypothetical protein